MIVNMINECRLSEKGELEESDIEDEDDLAFDKLENRIS